MNFIVYHINDNSLSILESLSLDLNNMHMPNISRNPNGEHNMFSALGTSQPRGPSSLGVRVAAAGHLVPLLAALCLLPPPPPVLLLLPHGLPQPLLLRPRGRRHLLVAAERPLDEPPRGRGAGGRPRLVRQQILDDGARLALALGRGHVQRPRLDERVAQRQSLGRHLGAAEHTQGVRVVHPLDVPSATFSKLAQEMRNVNKGSG